MKFTIEIEIPNNDAVISQELLDSYKAFFELRILRDIYRNCWIPNWKGDDDKYCIYLHKTNIIIGVCVYCEWFLSFQNQETAKRFLEDNRELIYKAKDLI